MKSARSWREWARVACWSTAIAVSAPACSFLFDLDTDQCAIDGDCARLGSDLSCRAGLCVADQDTAGSGGNGGTSGSNGGTKPSEAGQAGDTGGTGSPPPECTTHAECIDANFGQPYQCIDGSCVALVTDECPLVIGADNLRAEDPIIYGAYTLAPDGVSRSIATRNIDLVVSDFTEKVVGLRYSKGKRPIAFLVCNSYYPDVAPGTIDPFEPSLDHLVDEVRVPGILSTLSAKNLEAVYSQRLRDAQTFVVSPYEQDSELAALEDDGRLWNLLGPTSDLAPAYGPLLKRTEAYLRRTGNEKYLNLSAPGGKLRLALVSANIARETDVRDALLDLPVLGDFEVQQFQVESALLTESPDVGPLATGLLAFKPNIIVALAGSEFIQGVFPVLETGQTWPSATGEQQRPMYVLGASMAPETWTTYGASEAMGGFPTLMNRIVGVAYASAIDPKLRELYEARLLSVNTDLVDPTVLLGSESVYDATYMLIYATAAAGRVPELDGKQLAKGMQHLLEGTSYDVGPAAIQTLTNALYNGEEVGLNLTLGPPNWNAANGTRRGVGSVYCLNNAQSAYEQTFPKGPNLDALRYDPETDTLEDKILPCITNFCGTANCAMMPTP